MHNGTWHTAEEAQAQVTCMHQGAAARTAMHADDAVLDQGRQGQPVEEGINARPCPHACLSQPLQALQPEAKQCIDVRCLCTR